MADSVIGAFVHEYENGTDSQVVALRDYLGGTGKVVGDIIPEDVAMPYLVLAETSTQLKDGNVVGYRGWTSMVNLEFSIICLGGRAQVEAIQELIYPMADVILTFDTYQHSGPAVLENKTSFHNPDRRKWEGTVTLRYTIQKLMPVG